MNPPEHSGVFLYYIFKSIKINIMKKLLFVSVLILACCATFAQSSVVSKPFSSMWIKRSGFYSNAIGQSDNSAYIMTSYRDKGSLKKPKSFTDHLYTIDKSTLHATDMTVTVPGMHDFLGAVDGDNNIVTLYLSTTKKGDFITFTIGDIDKKESAVSISDETSVTFPANPSFWPEYITSKSPDGKLLAAIAVITGKKGVLENIHAVVVNDKGEFEWSGSIAPDFGGSSFGISNFAVDNDGYIYLPAYTCSVKGDKVSDVEFQVSKIRGKENQTFNAGVTFGKPQNFTTKIMSDGNVVVGGYFTKTFKNTMTQTDGYFFYNFNTKTNKFTYCNAYDFSENYAQKKAPWRLSSVLANQQYSIKADDIYELADGSLVLCGEHRFIKQIRDMQTNTITYDLLTKNILISTMRPDGSSAFSMIQKQQSAKLGFIPSDWKMMNISYSAFAHGNDMYFVFNEHKKNIPYPGDGVVFGMFGLIYNKPGEIVLMKLTPDQEVTQTILPDNKEQLIREVVFTDGDAFYATGITKDGFTINKFKLDK